MGQTAVTDSHLPPPLPEVKQISLDHPWRWLEAGWQDLRRAPRFSLSYGAFFVAVSYLLTISLFNGSLFFLVPPLAAGYFLVEPLLGVGLYQMSRNLERSQPLEFCQALEAWNANRVHLSAFGLILLFILLVWMMAANLVFALFFTQPMPTWENFIPVVFLSGDNIGFVIAGTLVGGTIAMFTFAVSAVSAPMLMDRQVDVITAMRTSLNAVLANWRPMLLWASLIAMFVGIGIVTFYIGLVVAMPVIGHATWHAYRDLVASED